MKHVDVTCLIFYCMVVTGNTAAMGHTGGLENTREHQGTHGDLTKELIFNQIYG